MEAALGWIGEIIHWFADWIPRLQLVVKGHAAVVFRPRGVKVHTGPKLFFWWPAVSEYDDEPVVRQIRQTDFFYIETADGNCIAVQVTIAFRIVDIETFLVENEDADDSIVEAAEFAARNVVKQKGMNVLQEENAPVNNALKREAQKPLEDLGVEVEYVRLNTLTRARMFGLIGNVSTISIGG